MVKIAVAGGSGAIAHEIINVLIAIGRHEVLVLSRSDAPATGYTGVTWVKVNYEDHTQLTKALGGVEIVLSFLVAHLDPGSVSQKALVQASIAAGVKRFAPNEWSGSTIEELPWYEEKGKMREYLAEINKDKKVIEYTLFQPGLLIDYMVPPGTSTEYIVPFELWIDFFKHRAIVIEGKEDAIVGSLLTIGDLANVVAQAVEYMGEWPVVSGIKGTDMTTKEILDIGTKIAGKPWDVTRVKEEDVRAGIINSPWLPSFEHPSVTPEQREGFSKVIVRGSLLSGLAGSWIVEDTWNKLLPDYEFTHPEDFLLRNWRVKV